VQLTSLVGRQEEIAEVKKLLDRTRLVTLSGPGGVGKTRLAVAGAESRGARAPLGALGEQLGDDRWLLVLDNLEQVIDVAGALGELLARCPGVAILVTSRRGLGLGAEGESPVAPRSLPGDPAGVPVEALLASP